MIGFILPILFPKEFRDVGNSIGKWIGDRLGDLSNFFGLSPAPQTTAGQGTSSWVPPFTGGQCSGVNYVVSGRDIVTNPPAGANLNWTVTVPGKISAPTSLVQSGFTFYGFYYGNQTANNFYNRGGLNWYGVGRHVTGIEITSVVRQGGLPDTCGNLPDPNPQPTLPYSQGGANASNPYTSDQLDTIYEGLPLALPANLLGALAGLAGLIGNALDALDGIKKIGDAIGVIQKLLDLLLKDKERRDRANPIFKKKLIGFWREIVEEDGYISFNQIPIGLKFAIPYAIQIVVENFPSTASRLLGTKSPDIGSDPYPLFYLQLQNNSFGIRDVVHVRSLNSFHYLDSLDRGCFYNFRQNPECKAKFRIFYELETEEVQAQ